MNGYSSTEYSKRTLENFEEQKAEIMEIAMRD